MANYIIELNTYEDEHSGVLINELYNAIDSIIEFNNLTIYINKKIDFNSPPNAIIKKDAMEMIEAIIDQCWEKIHPQQPNKEET